MLGNISIRTKILMGFLVPILIGGVTAFVNISDLQQIDRYFNQIASEAAPISLELEEIDTVTQRVIASTIVIVLITLSLALAFGLFLSHSISNSINKVRSAAEEIARGNLDKRIDVSSKDEIGQLAISFNRMTESLLEARRLPDNILRSMKDSLFVVDTKGNIVEANKAAVETLGFKKEELVGRSIKAIFKIKEDGKRKGVIEN